jgi:hypothetical protein
LHASQSQAACSSGQLAQHSGQSAPSQVLHAAQSQVLSSEPLAAAPVIDRTKKTKEKINTVLSIVFFII